MTLVALSARSPRPTSTSMPRVRHGRRVVRRRHAWTSSVGVATLIVIMLLGHWIEMRAVMRRGRRAFKEIAELLPAQARVAGGRFLRRRAARRGAGGPNRHGGSGGEGARRRRGDRRLVVRQRGARHRRGAPVEAHAGDTVFGGRTATARCNARHPEPASRATSPRSCSSSRRRSRRNRAPRCCPTRWRAGCSYAAVSVGLVAFVAWLAVTGSVSDALTRMVTVFVIACPHALGLAISARGGAPDLARRAQTACSCATDALEVAPRVNVVMMDKTGTLTEGDFRVAEVRAAGKRATPPVTPRRRRRSADDRVLALMAGLERSSSHPLAASIVAAAHEHGVQPAAVRDVQAVAGVGVKGVLGAMAMARPHRERALPGRAAHLRSFRLRPAGRSRSSPSATS